MSATIPTPALAHEPGTDRLDTEGLCIPRVALDCIACGERVVYCHLGRLTLRLDWW